MPAHERAGSLDRELVVRSESHRPAIPMWDSSDPERAPPPLPMNPGTTSPVTKGNVSPHIQAVANSFKDKMQENSPSSYTTNPMPPKSSPEKSLIKGHYHKRMQSFPNTDPRAEFFSYLESRSPERPLRATVLDPGTKQPESPTKPANSSSSNRDSEREIPPYIVSSRYLSKPILGESTPPSATMLAIQNMQLPETPSPSNSKSTPEPAPSGNSFETLSSQILSLTNMTSNLQREMAQLSRRSKDNATDLISLKAATNARDEDIRKSLRELSSNLASKFMDGDGLSSSPCSKKSYSAPRMSSPSSFAMAIERELCGSPTPISDGSASIALLEKVLREMATKEGQKKLLELVDELKSRPTSNSTSDKDTDGTITKMLEEILNIVKDHSTSKALVHSRTVGGAAGQPSEQDGNFTHLRKEMSASDAENDDGASRSALQPANVANAFTNEMLSTMNRVKNSVIEGGGLTNEVKALVRELRGEVLGMGRNIARKFEEAEAYRSAQDDKPAAPGKDEIAAIVDSSLEELQKQMAAISNENRHHAAALSEFRKAMNGSELYGMVMKALNEFPFPQPEPRGVTMEKEDILETVREAWETYKPEIELQNFGLERDEILECLTEGLKAYQPKHEEALTYAQVLAAVQEGMQNFAPPPIQLPPMISRDEIILTIRECLESFEMVPPSIEEEQLRVIRDEVLRAVAEAVASKDTATREAIGSEVRGELESGIKSALEAGVSRDAIFNAVTDGLMAHFAAVREADGPQVTKDDVLNAVNDAFAAQQSAVITNIQPQITREDVVEAVNYAFAAQQSALGPDSEAHVTKEDVINAVNDAFSAQNSALIPRDAQPTLSRDEILSVINEALENQGTREIELSREDLMEAISAGLQEAVASDNFGAGAKVLERLQDLLDGIKEEFKQYSAANGKDTEQVLDAIKDGLHVILKEIANYTTTASDISGKDEIMDTVKEGLGLLQANIEKTVAEAAIAAANHRSPNTPELLDAMEKEFEHLRQTISSLLIRSNVSSDKDEILDAIRDITEAQKTSSKDTDVTALIKEQFESLRDTVNMSIAPVGSTNDRDEVIAALREGFESLRDESVLRRDGGESVLSTTSELLDAFNDGVDSIRVELEKILNKPATPDTTGILETIKDGLESLKADMETLRQSQRDLVDTNSARGREIMLAGEPGNDDGNDNLRSLITQLQSKVEAFEPSPPVTTPPEDSLKKEHLDEVLEGLREVQASVAAGACREIPPDTLSGLASKEDTDAIETLLRNAKAQLDDLAFPAPEEIAKADHLAAVETVMKETKKIISELSTRLQEEGPTKSELGTLEGLLREVFVSLEEIKNKEKPDGEDSDKLMKSDLQTVEAMIFDVKTHIEELKLPDIDALPQKADLQELSALVTNFKEKMDADNELAGQAFEARKLEHGGLAEKVDEVKMVVGELGEEFKSRLDGSNEGLSELKNLVAGLMASSENSTTVESVKELTDLINREFERARGEQDAAKLETEERDATALVKQDESRAAIIVELGAKIDEKLAEVMAKYEELQNAIDSKFSETEGRDIANLDAVTDVKSIAEDIKLVIGSMGNSINETCDRINADTSSFLEKIGESCNKMEEMHNETKSHQEQNRADFERAVAATDRVEAQLHEFHPQLLESIQQILSLVDKHYEQSQKTAQEFRMEVSSLPSAITPLLPALPPPEEKYDDSQVQEKLNSLLEYTVNNGQVQEMLKTLLERSTNDPVHRKLDSLLEHTADREIHDKLDSILDRDGNAHGAFHEILSTLLERSTNEQLHEKINNLLDHATSTNGQVHDRLNEILERSTNEQVHEKLDDLLDHTASRNSQFQEMLNTLLERSTHDQLHEKLDGLLDHATSTNSQVHEKLNEILERSTDNEVHGKLDVLLEQAADNHVNEKLDTLIDHATKNEVSVTQMMKLDEMHKDIMETSRRMNEFFAAQAAMIAEDSETKRREAEEATIALERRTAQKEQVESEIQGLNDEKESLLKIISTLKLERDELVKQNTKYSKELSSLETALEIRHEEMQLMEERADSLEKRILEGVLDHARSVLLSRPGGMHNLKRVRSVRARKNSGASTTSTTKDARNILGNGIGIALKRRSPTASNPGSTTSSNTGKERRILSLSNVTGNKGAADRQGVANGGFTNLKRSHSVKSNSVLRKTSWGGVSSVANKENEVFPEEEEHQTGDESDTGTERRTSYAGKFTDNIRRVSAVSSIVDQPEEEARQEGEHTEEDAGSEPDHDAQAEERENVDSHQATLEDDGDVEDANLEKNMVLYGPPSDSGLGSEVAAPAV